jgi:hypothetical protein
VYDTANTKYFLTNKNDKEDKIVYLLPNQCFRISVEPLLMGDKDGRVERFYNASNLKCEIVGARYGKVEELKSN